VLALSPLAPAVAGLMAAVLVVLLPRAGWIVSTLAITITAGLQGDPGAALVVGLAGLAPALLLPARGTAWPLPAGAPALGVVGLAGCWPALAARAGSPFRRAVLGALGWCWLVLVGLLADKALYVAPLRGAPSQSVWGGSLHTTVHELLFPLARAGAFTPAVIWALGALILPLLVRRRSLAADAVAVLAWAAAVALATILVLGSVQVASASVVALGAVASAAAGLAPALGRNLRSMESPPSL
jgi:eukaryotic-like serine/threonine-protein kinase